MSLKQRPASTVAPPYSTFSPSRGRQKINLRKRLPPPKTTAAAILLLTFGIIMSTLGGIFYFGGDRQDDYDRGEISFGFVRRF